MLSSKTIHIERLTEKTIEILCSEILSKTEYIRDNSNVNEHNLEFYYDGVYYCLEEVLLTLIKVKNLIKQADKVKSSKDKYLHNDELNY